MSILEAFFILLTIAGLGVLGSVAVKSRRKGYHEIGAGTTTASRQSLVTREAVEKDKLDSLFSEPAEPGRAARVVKKKPALRRGEVELPLSLAEEKPKKSQEGRLKAMKERLMDVYKDQYEGKKEEDTRQEYEEKKSSLLRFVERMRERSAVAQEKAPFPAEQPAPAAQQALPAQPAPQQPSEITPKDAFHKTMGYEKTEKPEEKKKKENDWQPMSFFDS